MQDALAIDEGRRRGATRTFEHAGPDGAPTACVSVWHDTASAGGRRTSAVGGFEAKTVDDGVRVLAEAIAHLRASGFDTVVGPMDGNTWCKYRFLTERGTRPPFFMEPDQPDFYATVFKRAGFEPLALYTSAETDDLTHADPRLESVAARLARLGVSIRTLRTDDLEAELRKIHALSVESFADNFLYTPIDADTFVAMYEQVRSILEPSLVMLAEHDGDVVGFVFGIPDVAQMLRGEAVDTAIVKTVAIRRDRRYAGLGALLVQRCHDAAHAAGFRRAIHALMHEDNRSVQLSRHYAHPFRRYTLYARALDGEPGGAA